MHAAPGRRPAAQAIEAIGLLHMTRGDYERVRASFERITWNYPNIKDVSATALLYTGRTYEQQGQWAEAERAYRDIESRYPWTDYWLEAPLYLAWMHERRHDSEAAHEAYRIAVSCYRQRIAEAPTAMWGAKARGFLALVYRKLGRADEAAHVLDELRATEERTNRPDVLIALARVYGRVLEDPARADALRADAQGVSGRPASPHRRRRAWQASSRAAQAISPSPLRQLGRIHLQVLRQ